MSRNFKLFSIIVYIALILPMVFLPLGFDYSIFFVGGKILANGGKLYVDFIDIKPPLLYYLFALLYLIFKNHTLFYQLFNNFFILLTAIAIFEIVSLIFRNKWLSFFAPIPFILFCASFNYNYIYEPELGFSFIFALSTILLFKYPDKVSSAIVIGILSGIAFGLKYSFGIIIVPFLTFYVINTQIEKKYRQIFIFLASFTFVAAFPFIILLLQNGTLKDLYNILDFTNYYQASALFSSKPFKRITNNLEITIGVHYSLFFSIAFFYGIWKTFQQYSKKSLENSSETNKIYHNHLLFSFFCIFFSIIVEHQFLNYHFIRISTILSFYTTLGMYFIFKEFKELPRIVRYFLYPVAVFTMIFYTPLPRYVRTAIPTYYYFTNFEKYIDYFENKTTANTLFRQHTTIAQFVNEKINPSDTVMVLGGAAQIYTMLKECHYSAFPTSVFILSNFKKPKDWENRFEKELHTAKFIIIQDFDHNHFFGREVSSWEAFNENLKYRKILEDRYDLVLKTFSFYVFERRD